MSGIVLEVRENTPKDSEGYVLLPLIHKKTVTVDATDFDALALLTLTTTVGIGTTLPENARILGCEIRLDTPFSGGGNSSVSVDVGGILVNDIVDGATVFTGAPAAQRGNAGVNPNALLSLQDLGITFTADVGLNELTAGNLTVDVLYTVVP